MQQLETANTATCSGHARILAARGRRVTNDRQDTVADGPTDKVATGQKEQNFFWKKWKITPHRGGKSPLLRS